MPLQTTFFWAFVVTLGAAEWFVLSVRYFMSLQINWLSAFVLTLGAAEWFFTSVDSFMDLQTTLFWAFVVTLRAAEWFVTSVNFLMCLQIALLCKCSLTIAARVSCGNIFEIPPSLFWLVGFQTNLLKNFDVRNFETSLTKVLTSIHWALDHQLELRLTDEKNPMKEANSCLPPLLIKCSNLTLIFKLTVAQIWKHLKVKPSETSCL